MLLIRILSFVTQNFLFVLAGLAGIGFLIGFHELGHFLFCKLFNIRTPSFSIGFGPRIFTKKIGETEFALSAIPLGGYVEIAGSSEMGQGEQKDAHANDARSFAKKPYYQKLLVMLGGILFNFLFAYFALILLCMIGIPKPTPTIKTIMSDSAAQKYHLEAGDRITAVNGQAIEENLEKVLSVVEAYPHQEITLTIDRAGQEITLPITLDSKKDLKGKEVGALGVKFLMQGTPGTSFFEAIKQGIEMANSYIINTIVGFKNIFSKHGVNAVQGPVAIISMIIESISQSFALYLLLLAIISINLAVLNLIPLPILDGGQILHYTIEALIGRPVPIKIREYIHIASWLLVLALVLYLSANDIYQMAKPFISKLSK